jgi:hypothetical protein
LEVDWNNELEEELEEEEEEGKEESVSSFQEKCRFDTLWPPPQIEV